MYLCKTHFTNPKEVWLWDFEILWHILNVPTAHRWNCLYCHQKGLTVSRKGLIKYRDWPPSSRTPGVYSEGLGLFPYAFVHSCSNSSRAFLTHTVFHWNWSSLLVQTVAFLSFFFLPRFDHSVLTTWLPVPLVLWHNNSYLIYLFSPGQPISCNQNFVEPPSPQIFWLWEHACLINYLPIPTWIPFL